LASNLIGTDGARELAEELEINRMLEGLVLGGVDAEFHGARPNLIGSDGCKALLEALQRNPSTSLTALTLCNTSLSAEAGRHLAAFLEKKHQLQYLDISSNPLSSEGICALLPHCNQLRVLTIADTGC
jgi:Ran GTPase-activating protein (RanGAP) involved in mRNA processing and transport